MRKQAVPGQAARAQAKPWLVSRADESIARPVWVNICDDRDRRRLRGEEVAIEAEMAEQVRYGRRWWKLLKRLSDTRAMLIAYEGAPGPLDSTVEV